MSTTVEETPQSIEVVEGTGQGFTCVALGLTHQCGQGSRAFMRAGVVASAATSGATGLS